MQAVRVTISGRVQGLGVRPTIYRLARQWQLGGSVRNTPRGVEIELEGDADSIERFVDRLAGELPEAAVIEHREVESIAATGRGPFEIVREPARGPLVARVPPDLAACPRCLSDVAGGDPRRRDYPFTSCTLCGPRYSIIRAMPYEREDTAMDAFGLCPACHREYTTPGDRRFHAQTNACPVCGPAVFLREPASNRTLEGAEALAATVEALRCGRIVAVRGLGGYQLLADATDPDAVERLRQRKQRPSKPLAVMVVSLEEAERLAVLDERERQALAAPANAILLVAAREGNGLAAGIHPGLRHVGLLLPTTPLHTLLLRDAKRPLVCTSGNREGEPLEYRVEEAERNLAGIADLWLHHDREIERPIDDSVQRVIAGQLVTLRLARGLAPWPLDLPATRPLLALGGYLKSAAAWCNGVQSVLGPHVGDHRTLAARRRYVEELEKWADLFRFRPERLVHDAHPDYFTTAWAREHAESRPGIDLLAVQHHHAHVAAGMLQCGWLDRQVLGVSWDGTGYGTDGAIWGGEFLEVSPRGFQRIGHLRPFRLPGGEAAVREPWRVALALLSEALDFTTAVDLLSGTVDASACHRLRPILNNPRFSPATTSAGRLCDAVASLLLGVRSQQFDGQPAMWLEAAADAGSQGAYPLPLDGEPTQSARPTRIEEAWQLDWRPLLVELVADMRRGTPPPTIAMRFHRSLARGIAAVCRRRPGLPVVLSGGVFQNQRLTELVWQELAEVGRPVGLPGAIPPNDGGLAAGQLAIGYWHAEFQGRSNDL